MTGHAGFFLGGFGGQGNRCGEQILGRFGDSGCDGMTERAIARLGILGRGPL